MPFSYRAGNVRRVGVAKEQELYRLGYCSLQEVEFHLWLHAAGSILL